MIARRTYLLAVMLSALVIFTGCTPATDAQPDGKFRVVATTTMLSDLTKILGGEYVHVQGLMGPGIDPHLYQASAGDVTLMQNADLVVYNGLHLEGKMGDVFESLTSQNGTVACVCIGDAINEENLLTSEDDPAIYDPHIWFDVDLWKKSAEYLTQALSASVPKHSSVFEDNLANYLNELDELDAYVKDRTSEILPEQRVLVTAHDAFRYFGEAYGYEVKGLQGITTDSEVGTADVSNLAEFISERKIKAIFVESSVPRKTIEALQAAVKAKGFNVSIGGQLYSDSLGGEDSGASTYILTFKHNIDTIVDALK